MSTMAIDAYRNALRQGQRQLHACITKGLPPYPILFDDELPDAVSARQEPLGVIDVPAERIVGVRNASRQTAFSAGFMPLLLETSEFAMKWMALYDAHMEEGIRDPAVMVECMNRYFVLEGNKRVSVLRYSGAPYVTASVTRYVPPRDGSKESDIYYEYLDFYRATHVADVFFTERGRFPRLIKALGVDIERTWTAEEQRAFRAEYQRFSEAYEGARQKGGAGTSDAFLTYIEIHGRKALRDMTAEEIEVSLENTRGEIEAAERERGVALKLAPTPESEAPLINRLWPLHPSPLNVAFLYERTAITSPWTAAHEAGRRRTEKHFGGRVRTACYDGVTVGENDDEIIERAITDGAEVVFTTTPKMIGASVKAAVRHPDVKVLNCSMNMQHPSVRTYYDIKRKSKLVRKSKTDG